MSAIDIINKMRSTCLDRPYAVQAAYRDLGDGFTLLARPIHRGGQHAPFSATDRVAWFLDDHATEGERRITRRQALEFAAWARED